jgi:radical SAM-linked protein
LHFTGVETSESLAHLFGFDHFWTDYICAAREFLLRAERPGYNWFMQANYVQRQRIVFGKAGPTRYIGHLDLARTLERALNRARIPLAYTQGYNKRPRMQMASALPLGFTSECELADIWLVESVDPLEVKARLDEKMSPGILIRGAHEVALKGPALQALTVEATYSVALPEPPEQPELSRRIDDFLSATFIHRERRGKSYDLRPLVLELALEGFEASEAHLNMRLSLLPGKTGRPDEVMASLGFDPLDARYHRSEIILAEDPAAG